MSLNRLAFSATAHCLTGCAIGEVLGMIIGTALGWTNVQTIVLAIALAFLFGYSGLDYVDVLNSWGRGYPHLTRMPAKVLERLWKEDGEVGIVTDR